MIDLFELYFKSSGVILCQEFRKLRTLYGFIYIFSFFVQWHINLPMLLNAKPILIEEELRYKLKHNWHGGGESSYLPKSEREPNSVT